MFYDYHQGDSMCSVSSFGAIIRHIYCSYMLFYEVKALSWEFNSWSNCSYRWVHIAHLYADPGGLAYQFSPAFPNISGLAVWHGGRGREDCFVWGAGTHRAHTALFVWAAGAHARHSHKWGWEHWHLPLAQVRLQALAPATHITWAAQAHAHSPTACMAQFQMDHGPGLGTPGLAHYI